MSTYVLMRILESAPARYDKGLRILTMGKVDAAYDRLTSRVQAGQMVLDLGCGTGALALRAAHKGAKAKGIDVNPQMLEIARHRAEEANLTHNVEFSQQGVAELGSEEPQSYDVIMSGLCFSELSEDEVTYTLQEVGRILKPGGLLLLADEVRPERLGKRVLHGLTRFPLSIVAYLVAQTTTRAVRDLPQKIEEAGLLVESVRLNTMESFLELVARKPGELAR